MEALGYDMPCYSPLNVIFTHDGKKTFRSAHSMGYRASNQVPCGRCIGCRLDKSRDWAIRCAHEASLYSQNSFITLTYDPENVPYSLDVRTLQLFLKRLRKRYGNGIRFFACGEYGETFGRPHYHICLFNFNFPDRKFWSIKQGNRLYRSASLEELWPHGFSLIGSLSFQSAAYVARYVCKKYYGEKADEHYQGRVPEFCTMSRRPGIGDAWIKKYFSDVYPHDYVIYGTGNKCKPSRFYDKRISLDNPDLFVHVRDTRLKQAAESSDNTLDRLVVRDEVKNRKFESLYRSIE